MGGELYRVSSNLRTAETKLYIAKNMAEFQKVEEFEKSSNFCIFGPWRIRPGGLSVSRTFGDIESKVSSYGGMSGNVIAEPDIIEFDLTNSDFIALGCLLIRRWHF